jgi:dihydrolipoamide dehydrogenase
VFKQEAVDGNTKGIDFLFKKNKITPFRGTAKILGPGKVQIDGKDIVDTKAIIIATGSDVASLKGVEIDEKQIVSSTGALTLEKVPETLVVIGAGVIGLELGSVWARLGSNVTVIEYLDRILPGMDLETAKAFQRLLTKQGFAFKLASKVTKAEKTKGKVRLSVEPAAGGQSEMIEADAVLLAIGRVPNTNGLGLDEAGVKRDGKGRIEVGSHFETNVPGIYAIGDVIRGPMLAHKGEDEGVALAELLAGQAGHVNYDVIPSVVYTSPEIAQVGKTEEELKAEGRDYKTGKFLFLANGRAKANHTTDGFVKILADAKSDRVLGVHILGAQAGELIHEAAVLMEFGGSAEDLARTCHAHPTLAEAVKEAAMAVAGRAIHS